MRGMHVLGSVAAGTLSEVPARHSLQAIRRACRSWFSGVVHCCLALALAVDCAMLGLGAGVGKLTVGWSLCVDLQGCG